MKTKKTNRSFTNILLECAGKQVPISKLSISEYEMFFDMVANLREAYRASKNIG